MSKAIENKPATKNTEATMRKALSNVSGVKVNRDDDDPVEILSNAVDELLELRAMKAEIASFVQHWNTELTRR